ncbi:unnamed protein product, partial [Durusdinium trenchii]
TTGCRALVEWAHRIVLCSASELGCFKDCILSRATLQDYNLRIWPTYKQRALRFWSWLTEEPSLLAKVSVLDEEAFRDQPTEALDRFAAEYLRAALPSSTAGASLSEVKSWRGRVECEAPERNQRIFQQVRKDAIHSFEMEARSFAARVTNRLLSGSMKDSALALKDLADYRLSASKSSR